MPWLIKPKLAQNLQAVVADLSQVFTLAFAFPFLFWSHLVLLFRSGTRENWYLQVDLFGAAICVLKVAATISSQRSLFWYSPFF
jgi:hypothetical protein